MKNYINFIEQVEVPTDIVNAFKHEIRTPLTSTVLNIQITKMKLEKNIHISTEEMLAFLKKIEDQLMRISKVLDKE